MINVVLVEPEIAQNAGNIARTCACVGAKLHMVEPFGFRLTDKYLKRSGLDYWDKVEFIRWPSIDAFLEEHSKDELHLFTGRTNRNYCDDKYRDNSFLLFGRETAGLEPELLNRFADKCVRIPMKDETRSLNLSNAVAVGVYEACRQIGFSELK